MAIAYAHMLRYVGGVPIMDHSVTMSDEMQFPRKTFAETVNHIVKLCDEAAPDLPWFVSANDDGRLTRASVLGLKLRILCFAASPTFNSDTKWHPQADEYTCYGNYDPARWQAARVSLPRGLTGWPTEAPTSTAAPRKASSPSASPTAPAIIASISTCRTTSAAAVP